ncbi:MULTISPECIES: hypothetical protein [Micromonospora]|uniref:hypothetical protein n=1 Tax=Micromonospora TaxID=1873 RepID=UPI00352BA454|nr:hypothetical protein OG423_05835 [Micromonospora zamorensis]
MTSPATTPTGNTRPLWTALIVLTAALVATAAGLLSVAGGVPVPLAIIAGGGAFGGTVALLLAVAHFLTSDRG